MHLAKTFVERVRYPVNPYLFAYETTIPLKQQLIYINGRSLPANAPFYKALLQKVVPLRQAFRATENAQKRADIAKVQIQHWQSYVQSTKSEIKSSITEKTQKKLEESLQSTKERLDADLHCSRLPQLVGEYSKAFRIDFNILPIHMAALAHPHFGYLSRFDLKLSTQQISALLRDLEVAFHVHENGFVLHSNEVMAFAFWKLVHGNTAPISLQAASEFLKPFRITVQPTVQSFKKEFGFYLKQRAGELGQAMRFDMWRGVVLQRNL